MKAIRIHSFGGPDVMVLESVPDLIAGPGQVIVQAQAIGINPVDTYIRSGMYGDRPFPYTLGMDAAGAILSVGADITRYKVKQRVYVAGSVSGTYAEQILCKESQVQPLPSTLSFEQGAAIGVPYTTAYYALFYRGHALAGETVLIHGASGAVGMAALQLARPQGLTVIGTGGTPKGRDLVLKEGAHHVLDHTAPNAFETLMSLTQNRGVDLIIEMLANVNLGKDLTVLAPQGRVVVVGNRGQVEINPRDLMSRNADIRGMTIMKATERELANIHMAITAGLDNGTLRPVVGQTFPLADVARAHEAILKPGSHGKIVLIP